MAKSSKKKVRSTPAKKDRISVLPRNIQETILCFLPLRDAVRTSILSKYWRRCWTSIPNLVFDESILGELYSIKSINTSQCYCSVLELTALRFVSVINIVLLLHNAPILKFSLEIPQYCYSTQIFHDYIDQWIPVFSRKGIRQFTLTDQYHEKYRVHNFSSLDLTHLRLVLVWFPYKPASGGLNYLRIIELYKVTASEQSIFDCPVLEKLNLILCRGLLPINFHAPNLKCLHQIYDEMTSEYSLAGLKNLTEFSYRLSSYGTEMQTAKSDVVKVFDSLDKIEKISIAKYFIKYLAAGGSPNRFSKPLHFLKTLSISHIKLNCLSEVSCLLCLIRSAPNLCRLHISADPDPDAEEEDFEDYCEEDYEDCTVDRLEIVTLSHFQGLNAEMELVKFLLAHSPLLKTMFIHRDRNMEKDVVVEIAEEMLEFSRASSRAQIKQLKHPFDAVDYGPWVELWI